MLAWEELRGLPRKASEDAKTSADHVHPNGEREVTCDNPTCAAHAASPPDDPRDRQPVAAEEQIQLGLRGRGSDDAPRLVDAPAVDQRGDR